MTDDAAPEASMLDAGPCTPFALPARNGCITDTSKRVRWPPWRSGEAIAIGDGHDGISPFQTITHAC